MCFSESGLLLCTTLWSVAPFHGHQCRGGGVVLKFPHCGIIWRRCVPVVYGDGVSPVLAGAEMSQAVAESLQQANDADAPAVGQPQQPSPSETPAFAQSSAAATPEVESLSFRSNGASSPLVTVAARRIPLTRRTAMHEGTQNWDNGRRRGKGQSDEEEAA
jgi:hypothetical protein